MALALRWRDQGVADDAVRGAMLISGPHDLEPVMLSARSSYVKLTKQEERDYSPVLQASRIPCPVFVGYAERDTDEFRRQSQAFARALEAAGKLNGVECFAGRHHFQIMQDFGNPDSPLVCAIVSRMA